MRRGRRSGSGFGYRPKTKPRVRARSITNAALAHGADVIEDLRTGKGHIVAVHLKETLPGKFREIPYGTGHVDFDSCIWTARELGVMMFVAEFWHLPGQDWRGEIEKARAFLAPKLDACYGGASWGGNI